MQLNNLTDQSGYKKISKIIFFNYYLTYFYKKKAPFAKNLQK
jgi:hypothetical protein